MGIMMLLIGASKQNFRIRKKMDRPWGSHGRKLFSQQQHLATACTVYDDARLSAPCSILLNPYRYVVAITVNG